MPYEYECIKCHAQIVEGNSSNRRTKLRTAICIPCTHDAVDECIGVDVEPSAVAQHLGGMREGEALALALDDANRKAVEARRKATEALAEAEKWESIAADLQTVISKTRTSARDLKRSAPAAEPTAARGMRPRGFWNAAVLEIMRSFPAAVVGPTKNEVFRCMRKRYPEEKYATLYHVVTRAVATGVVVLSGNNLFLPENDPQRERAGAAVA